MPHEAHKFTPGTPGRTRYLALRALNVFFCTILLIFVSIAAGKYNRLKWLDPSLSPGITSFLYSTAEIIAVVGWDTRAHHLTRVLYDGVIAVGFAIAAGFLGSYALPYMNGNEKRGGNPDGEVIGALGAVVLTCMLIEFIIYTCIAAEGVRDTMKFRRQREEEGTAKPPATPVTV